MLKNSLVKEGQYPSFLFLMHVYTELHINYTELSTKCNLLTTRGINHSKQYFQVQNQIINQQNLHNK